jgi:hypothetical protein
LPYLEEAYEAILLDLEKTVLDSVKDVSLAKEVVSIVKVLCSPDPDKRSHPSNLHPTKYSLERYISWFIKLARVFEAKVI